MWTRTKIQKVCKNGSRIISMLCMSVLLTTISSIPTFAQPLIASDNPEEAPDTAKDLRKSQLVSNEATLNVASNDTAAKMLVLNQHDLRIGDDISDIRKLNSSSIVKENTYDTEDGRFRLHYKNVSEDYVKFIGHAFSKAREFQLVLGFNDAALTRTTHDSSDGRVAIYVKDLIYDGRASETVIGQNQLQYFLMSDNLEKWQVYLAAAHCYFMAVQATYNTLGYEASGEQAWINDGIARFITLYTAMNDPEYKEYDSQYKQYGYLDNVIVEGKNTYGYAPYQVPTITSDAPLQNGLTKLGDLSVSYWYYLYKLYGTKIIQDVMEKAGSYNDDSVRTVSSVLTNYNATFVQSIAGWYESLGFWNKGKIGNFSVYEGLMLVDNEVFAKHKSSELPLKVENQVSRYGASFVSLEFDSRSPIVQLRFLNSGEAAYLYVYIHNTNTDEYYYQIHEVERGYVDFWVWTENAEINFIVIGGEKSFRGGYTIAAV